MARMTKKEILQVIENDIKEMDNVGADLVKQQDHPVEIPKNPIIMTGEEITTVLPDNEQVKPEEPKEVPLNIEELDGVGPAITKKLNALGIYQVQDLAVASAHELFEVLAPSGKTLDQCVSFVILASEYLQKNGVLDKPLIKSSELLNNFIVRKRYTTGDLLIDTFLGGGGFESKSITEFYGKFGCLLGNSRIIKHDGSIHKIQNIGKQHLEVINQNVKTIDNSSQTATTFFKYEKAPVMEVITNTGKSIVGTYNHPLFSKENGWTRIDQLKIGEKLMVTDHIDCDIEKYAQLTDLDIQINKFGPKFKGNIPKIMDEQLAGIIGFIMSDGWFNSDNYTFSYSLFDRKKSLSNKLQNMIKNIFNLNPCISNPINNRSKPRSIHGRLLLNNESGIRYEYNSQIITKLLKQLTNNKQEIPEEIFQSKNSVVASFISWLFSGDGHISFKENEKRNENDRTIRKIELSNKNLQLLRDIQLLLLRFGIHSRISLIKQNNVWVLTISQKQSMISFLDNIGFQDDKRNETAVRLRYNIDNYMSYPKILDNRFEKISKIIIHEDLHTVYDIEVPKNHSFIANGIVSHNSGKSQTCFTTAAVNADKGVKVLYVDTENTYSPDRIQGICESKQLDSKRVHNNIFVLKPLSASILVLQMNELNKTIRNNEIGLVIVDSIIALHRSEFYGRGSISSRQQQLGKIMGQLSRNCQIHDIAVIITNQMIDNPTGFGALHYATGGNVMSHASSHRISLTKSGKHVKAFMEDSPRYRKNEILLDINDPAGIKGIDEKKVKST